LKGGGKFMKKFLIMSILTFFLFPQIFFCQETGKDSFQNWLNKMEVKIQRLQKKSSTSTFTTVAGVRGAKQEVGKDKIYWKGKKGEKGISPKELTLFQTGINYAKNGEYEKSLEILEKFVKTYPKSKLFADAQKTIFLIKEKKKE
jgi:TolA-binding protein